MSAPDTVRPSWYETRLEMARTIAQRSLCSRSKVGAIITDTTNRIVGEGYNGPPAGFSHGNQPCNIWCKRTSTLTLSPDYTDCPSLHAEANALLESDRSKRAGGTIFITSHVCFGCAKLIANSGLACVVVDSATADEHRNPLASYQFLIQCGISVVLQDLVMQARLHKVPWGTAPLTVEYGYMCSKEEKKDL